MRVAKAVTRLTEAFERLPGIGPKSAARLTYYLLAVPQEYLDRFSAAVSELKKNTRVCTKCFNVAESDPCDICQDGGRDAATICVVQYPLDVLAFERGNRFTGVYHVLGGVIDPLRNIGPDEIRIAQLMRRIEIGEVVEIILALNPNMEGEATCMYINKAMKARFPDVKVTRLAHGLPVGADIEYADDITLARAIEGRREY